MSEPSVRCTKYLAIDLFTDQESFKGVTPDIIQRFAFSKDLSGVEMSALHGFQPDDRYDVIDVIKIEGPAVNVKWYDLALIVRIRNLPSVQKKAQQIGSTLSVYMRHVSDFVTKSVEQLHCERPLHRGWQTIVFLREEDGTWRYRDLGEVSVQRSTEGQFAVLKWGRITRIPGDKLISVLLDRDLLQEALSNGRHISDRNAPFLVQTPQSDEVAAAVASNGCITFFDNELMSLQSSS